MLGKGSMPVSRIAGLALAVMLAATGGYIAGSRAEAPQAAPLMAITPLFVTSTTVMDEPIVYPTGAPAELTASIMALPPGGDTGLHVHNVPLAGIVLEGEITVDYGERGTKVFKTGEAIAETMAVPHRGINKGDKPVRIFVVYMGAKGVPVTTKR
jgi:quercetin dioxygenase-like cupin family protein